MRSWPGSQFSAGSLPHQGGRSCASLPYRPGSRTTPGAGATRLPGERPGAAPTRPHTRRGARGHRASLTCDPGRAGPPLRLTARWPRGRRAPAPHRAHLESGNAERPTAITCRRPFGSAPGPRVSPGARPSAAGQSRTTLAPPPPAGPTTQGCVRDPTHPEEGQGLPEPPPRSRVGLGGTPGTLTSSLCLAPVPPEPPTGPLPGVGCHRPLPPALASGAGCSLHPSLGWGGLVSFPCSPGSGSQHEVAPGGWR